MNMNMNNISKNINSFLENINKLSKKYINNISTSHAINLQVLTYLTAIGGYMKFPKNEIVILVIILFLATIWPDIMTFYRDELFSKDNKKKSKREAENVLISETIVIIILLMPLLVIKEKITAIFTSYLLACILLFINNHVNMNYDLENNISSIILYLFVTYIIYLITEFLTKIIK